jgi:hypothetical protein
LRSPLLPILLAAALGGCSVEDAKTAASARTELIGVSAADLSFCAGPPGATERLDDHTQLLAYTRKSSDAHTVSVNIPVIGGGVNVGQGGDCEATFKVVDGRVAALRYSGDTDAGPGGTDAACAPIVQHCLQDLPAREPSPREPSKRPGDDAGKG